MNALRQCDMTAAVSQMKGIKVLSLNEHLETVHSDCCSVLMNALRQCNVTAAVSQRKAFRVTSLYTISQPYAAKRRHGLTVGLQLS